MVFYGVRGKGEDLIWQISRRRLESDNLANTSFISEAGLMLSCG